MALQTYEKINQINSVVGRKKTFYACISQKHNHHLLYLFILYLWSNWNVCNTLSDTSILLSKYCLSFTINFEWKIFFLCEIVTPNYLYFLNFKKKMCKWEFISRKQIDSSSWLTDCQLVTVKIVTFLRDIWENYAG